MDRLVLSAHWLLRVALAAVFFYHGSTKFLLIRDFAAMTKTPLVLAFTVVIMEVLGALLVALGALSKDWVTRLGALMIAPIMLVAIKIHWGQWSFLPSASHPMGGIEFQVVLLAIALYFLIKGNKV